MPREHMRFEIYSKPKRARKKEKIGILTIRKFEKGKT